MNRFFIVLVMIMATNAVMAEFVISYPENYKELKRTSKSVLLMNKASVHLVEVGSGLADEVVGTVSDAPISDILNVIIPDGWMVYGAKDVDLNTVVADVYEGETWTEMLGRTGKDKDLIFTVDWQKKELFVENHKALGLFDSTSKPIDPSSMAANTVKTLHLRKGDLRRSLEWFSHENNFRFEVDSFVDDRELSVHPTVAEYTHPIPSCVTWTLPEDYEEYTTSWLVELNRILVPFKLKIFLFSNDVLFLTSLHDYGSKFCVRKESGS